MAMRSSLLALQPLRLSASATNPSLRVMATGVRAFQTARPNRAAAPQSYIKGTVNDPTTYPEPNAAHGSYHWSVERGLSVALIPIIAAGVAKHGTSAVLDGVLALTLVAHSHIGFACCLDDYVHKRKFPIAGPVSSLLLKLATAGTLYGLYEFNTNDVGLSELVARVWSA